MRSNWQDILILGLLVLLFGVIYRRKPALRLRFWITGWFFVVAHFVALVLPATNPFWGSVQDAAGASGLILCGICFILAATSRSLTKRSLIVVAAAAGVPALAYLFLTSFTSVATMPLVCLVLAGECTVVWIGFRYSWGNPTVLWGNNLAAILCGGWLLYFVVRREAPLGLNAILTQLFLLTAILYWNDFRRISVGVLTASTGLVAWAMVFPVGTLTDSLFPHLAIPAEIWNIPKYFVEFGMILTLMEDQIFAAKWQGEQYKLLFDSNPHPMFIYDATSFGFLRVNDAALRQYGYDREEFLKLNIFDLHEASAGPGVELILANSKETIRTTGPWPHTRKDHSEFQAEISSHPIEFEGHNARFCMAMDVTDRQRLHEQLVHRANHDTLTNLPNRFLLEQRMRLTLESAGRRRMKAAVLCIDLDRFKQVNDSYGHAVGDICLQEVAARLTTRLRETDTVARTGGEEFAVVLGDLHSDADAEKVAKDLLARFQQQKFTVAGFELDLSASVGIAIYPDHGMDGNQLWHAADMAMYCAKKSGGNRYAIVGEEEEISSSILSLISGRSNSEAQREA